MATDTSANIGIRVFLDDAASRGLYAVNTQLGQAGTLARRAGLGFGEMSTAMAGLAVVSGLVASFAFFAGVVALSVKNAADFEQLEIRIQRATNATTTEMQLMGNTLMDVGSKSIFSLEEVAQGFVLLGQRGISAKDIINGVGQAGVYLAESIGATPVQAMGLLASTMASFGIDASHASQVVDLLQFAFEHGVPSVTQLTTGLAKIGSVASLLHVPLDQVIPALDILGRAMGSGSTAATALYYFMSQVSSGTKTFKAEIEKLGLSFYDIHGQFIGLNQSLDLLYTKLKDKTPKEQADILHALFNIKAGTGIGILMEDLSKLHDLANNLAKSHDNLGVAIERAKKQEDSAAGAWKGVTTNMQDVLTLMGGPFLTIMEPVLLKIRDMVSGWRNFAQQNPQTMAAFVALGAAVAAFGLILAIAMSPLAPFIGIMLGVMAAVAGVTAGILWLRANWIAVMAVMAQVWAVTEKVLTVLLILGAIIVGIKVASLTAQFVAFIPTLIRMATVLFADVIPALLAYANQMAMMVVRAAIAASFNLSTIIPSLIASAAAWWANAIAELAAIGPYILLAAVIAGAIVGLVLLIQHLGFMNVLIKTGQAVWAAILPALQEAGAAIKGAFLEALKQLQPVWNQLVTAFNQAKPFLMWLGIALGVLIAVAVAIFIGSLRAAINVLSAVITMVIHVVSGIIQAFSGVVQFFMGFFTVLHGIFTGNFKEISNGFNQMGQGILNIVKGLWNAVSAVFVGAFNIIKGFVTGFISGVIGFFQNLAGSLIHHSIIPDMLSAIIGAILGFVPRALSAFANFVTGLIQKAMALPGQIKNALGNLANLLFNAGQQIVQGLINGFMSMVQNLINTVGNALAQVRNLFPHSPAKEGPLTDLHTWMPNVVKMLVDTTDQSAPALHASMGRVAGAVKSGFSSGVGTGGAGSAGGETYNLQIDGRTFMSFFHSKMTGELSANGLARLQR